MSHWSDGGRRLTRWPSRPVWAPQAVLAGLILCASGCTSFSQWLRNDFKLGPNYQEPTAPVEVNWIDFQHDPRVKEDEPHDLSDWWTVFQDPKLNDLIQKAANQNLTLRIAGTRILQAQAARGIAVGNLFPQVQQAFGGYDRVQTSKTIANSESTHHFDEWSQGFNLSWEIDFWGKFRRALESADASLDATIEGYDNVRVLLLSDVATTYVQIRTLQEQLRLLKENIQLQEEALKIVEAQHRAGQADAADVLQTRNNVERTRSLIPPLHAGLRQANNALCVLLGIAPRDMLPELGDGVIPTASREIALGIPADLLRRRPDVRQAERRVAAECAQIGVAESDLYPQFAINGVIQWQAQKLNDLYRPDSISGSVGPSFVWNILNYGRIVNSVRQQQARFEQAVYSYQATVLGAQREAEDAIIGFLQAQDQADELRLAVRDITELNDILLTQANAGARNFDRVYVVQAQATVQQDNLAKSTASIALNLIRIYRALGGGWQDRLQQQTATGPATSSPPASASFQGKPTNASSPAESIAQ